MQRLYMPRLNDKTNKQINMNIQPANRLNTVSEYYFSMKLREVAEMNAAGKNVINLGIGNPDLHRRRKQSMPCVPKPKNRTPTVIRVMWVFLN
jgi:hypothetical protein